MATTIPQYVAFKGDNGNYLCPRPIDNGSQLFLKFKKEGREETARFELIVLADETDRKNIRIRSVFYPNKFWKRDVSSNCIVLADKPDGTSNSSDESFNYSTLDKDKHVVALLNNGNKRFCERYSEAQYQDCLKAESESYSPPDTHLVWEEFPLKP